MSVSVSENADAHWLKIAAFIKKPPDKTYNLGDICLKIRFNTHVFIIKK